MMILTEKEILFIENKIKKLDDNLKLYNKIVFPMEKILRLDLVLKYFIFKYRTRKIIKERNELIELLEVIKEVNNANKL
jgi:hypothetical protein